MQATQFSSVVLRGIFCFWEIVCLAFCAPLCVFPLFAWLLVAVSEREVWREKLASEHRRPGAGTPRAPGRAKAGTLASSDACSFFFQSLREKFCEKAEDLQRLRRTGAGGACRRRHALVPKRQRVQVRTRVASSGKV